METTTNQAAPADASKTLGSEAEILRALEGMTVDSLLNSESVTPQDPGKHASGEDASQGEKAGDQSATSQAADSSSTTTARTETDPNKTEQQTRDDKSTERASKSWEDINREKAELARNRTELERQRQELEQRRAELLPEAQKAKTTADDYDRMASEWAAEGKDHLAKAAKERAALLRRSAQETEQQAQVAQLRQQQMAVMREVVEANPDLKDTKSALHVEVEKLMRQRPVLASYPDGIRDAVEVARLRLQAGTLEALRRESADLKKRLSEREKLLQPGTGAPSAASVAGDTFDSLPSAERHKRIEAELRAAESRGEPVFQ